MKRILLIILLVYAIPSCTNAQTDTSFNLSQALSDMIQLEQQYSENPDVSVANKLIQWYKIISENYVDDYFTLSRCRMLAEVQRYDEAIVLSDSLSDKDKTLFKDRLCLMKASYVNDTALFGLYISKVLNYLNDVTSKYAAVEDSLMQISFGSGFSSDEDIYALKMLRMKYCYQSVANGLEITCQQLMDKAYEKDWDINNLEWLLKYIQNFDYMSFTWW